MDSSTLKTWQAAKLNESLGPSLAYLNRLQQRMEKVGFPCDDKLYMMVCEARDIMMKLCVETHYLSCKSGVGGPPKE